MSFTPYGTPLTSLAATPFPAGFALQNATPTLFSYTTPNDGKEHRVQVFGSQATTVAETGGGVSITFTDPGGTPRNITVFSGNVGVGIQTSGSVVGNAFTVAPNTVVSLVQSAALTLGAATVYAELWGS